jgi:hypothetical protein
MTAAHVVNTYSGTNGAVGDTVAKPIETNQRQFFDIGIITVNPAWTAGASCPMRDTVQHIPFDY